MSTDRQQDVLLAALHQRPMTTLEIYQAFGILRPAARVFDLRQAGHRIATDIIRVPNRRGDLCRVARYAALTAAASNDPTPDLWEVEQGRVSA